MKPWKPVAVLSSALALTLPLPAEILERVVVKVNGDIVTLTDFTARQISEAQAARVTPDRIEQFLRDNNARILQSAIDDVLILQKAADMGMKLRPEYIKEVIDNIKKENNIESDEAFLGQLSREGLSLDDLKRNIERSILTRQIITREVDSKVQVTEQDARADYEARKAEYSTPARLRLQEILVRGDDAEKKASDVVRRARAGEDFAQLARSFSAAPTRAAGGELGELSHGDMNPEIEKVARTLEIGGVSDPMQRGDAYLILRLASRTDGSVVPFADVKEEILKQLGQTRRTETYDRFVDGLRKAAVIDIRVREVPLQVDLPTSGSILDPPAEPGAEKQAETKPAAADTGDEFSVTPQTKAERVAPAPAPRPTPTPKPH
jgi:peptidyl-prolyl cis-trans isomerase SurA